MQIFVKLVLKENLLAMFSKSFVKFSLNLQKVVKKATNIKPNKNFVREKFSQFSTQF